MSRDHSIKAVKSAQRLAGLQQGQICEFFSYRGTNPEEFTTLDYGDFHPVWSTDPEPEHYFLPDLLAGSDYSGCSVHRSNHRVFSEQFGDLEGVPIHPDRNYVALGPVCCKIGGPHDVVG